MIDASPQSRFELTEFGVLVASSEEGEVHVGPGRDGQGRCLYLLRANASAFLDVLAVGLRSPSLREFAKRSKHDVFRWHTSDGAFFASGSVGCWTLRFAGTVAPVTGVGASNTLHAMVRLSRQESEFLKAVLFTAVLDRATRAEVAELLATMPRELVAQREEALGQLPGLARAASFWNDLGVELGMEGQRDSSSACFQRARSLAPGWDEPMLNASENLRQAGRHVEALALVERVHPAMQRYFAIKGNVLFGLQRFEEAGRCFEDEVERNPGFEYAYSRLLDVLETTGSDRFEHWLRRAIFRFPSSPAIAAAYCRHFFHARDYLAVVDVPGGSSLRESLSEPGVTGGISSDQANWSVATYRSAAAAMLSMDARDVGVALKALGRSRDFPGRCGAAHALLELCVETGVADGVSLAHRSLCAKCASRLDVKEVWEARASSRAGDHVRALSLCEAALGRRPKDAMARWQQWWTLDDLDRAKEALAGAGAMWQDREEWASQYPSQFALLPYNLGLLCGKVGRHADAVEWYGQAVKAIPGQYQQRENLAIQLLLDGRIPEAQEAWEAGCRLRRLASGDQLEGTSGADAAAEMQASFNRLVEFARAHIGSSSYALDVTRFHRELVPPIGSEMCIAGSVFTMGEVLTAFRHAGPDAGEARRYASMMELGDYSELVVRLAQEVGDWESLPPAARSALLEAERRVVEATPRDYSPDVAAFAKAVEVTLYVKVFMPFQQAWGRDGGRIVFAEQDRIKLDRFVRFLERGQALELGSMLFYVGLATGRTAARNPILAEFARYQESTGFSTIFTESWRQDCERLASEYRNPAVHSAVLTRQHAMEARDLAMAGLRPLLVPMTAPPPGAVPDAAIEPLSAHTVKESR